MIIVPTKRPDRMGHVLAMRGAQTVREAIAICGPEYKSIGAARNAGLRLARERGDEFAYFWDDDNYYGARYVESMREILTAGAVLVSQGIAFTRFADGLYQFDTRRPGSFCPGHCTAVRVADAVPFPESSGWEDVEWSKRMFARGHFVTWAPPWHAVYDRRGADHVCGMSRAEFLKAFGGAVRVGDVPDSYVDTPRGVVGARVMATDAEIFAAMRARVQP